jgi:hypothetical protein
MTLIDINTEKITRLYIDDLEGLFEGDPDRDQASTILNYHDGNDVTHIKWKMAERYATEVRKEKNSTTGEIESNVVKTRAAQVAAINNNLFEVSPRGMTRKIASNVATLSENSEFEYNDEQFQLDIEESRERGQFGLMFSRLDEISVVVGSSVFLLQVNNGDFQYQPTTPDKVWVIFGDEFKIGEDLESADPIPVDKLKIDHAQCVIVQTDKDRYAAYFGRSTKYENGRLVQYEASSPFAIPEIGVEGANDLLLGDDDYSSVHNPLTVWQDDTGDYTTPEYPIEIWQGTTAGIGKELMPVQTNLYELSKEIDLASSRVLMASNKSAVGSWFFTNEGGASPNQPTSFDEGVKKLEAGQSAMVLTVPSSNIDVANKNIMSIIASLGDSYAVPQYQLSLDANVQVPSGTALMELNRPQVKFQNKRKDINDTAMDRIFQIEKALAGIENGSPVGDGVEQTWILKPTDIFKTDIEMLTEAQQKISLGIADKATVLADIDGVTVEEAQEEIDALVVAPVANTTANRLGI